MAGVNWQANKTKTKPEGGMQFVSSLLRSHRSGDGRNEFPRVTLKSVITTELA